MKNKKFVITVSLLLLAILALGGYIVWMQTRASKSSASDAKGGNLTSNELRTIPSGALPVEATTISSKIKFVDDFSSEKVITTDAEMETAKTTCITIILPYVYAYPGYRNEDFEGTIYYVRKPDTLSLNFSAKGLKDAQGNLIAEYTASSFGVQDYYSFTLTYNPSTQKCSIQVADYQTATVGHALIPDNVMKDVFATAESDFGYKRDSKKIENKTPHTIFWKLSESGDIIVTFFMGKTADYVKLPDYLAVEVNTKTHQVTTKFVPASLRSDP